MARIINIDNKLNNEPVFIVFNGKQHCVNNCFKIILRGEAMTKDGTTPTAENLIEIIELALGKSAIKEIEGMTVENVAVVFNAIMAAVQGRQYEDADTARFQQ